MTTAMTTEEWYREFHKRAEDDPGVNKRGVSTREYTKAISNLLKKMAADRGYEVTKERTSHGGGRLDQTWRKGSHEIAIEHENDETTIEKEIDNLCGQGCQLKILITYVPDIDFFANANDMANKIEREIAKRNFHGEFLLVIGSYCDNGWMSDWAAFRSVTQTRIQPLRARLRRKLTDNEHTRE